MSAGSTRSVEFDSSRASTNREARAISYTFMILPPACSAIISNERSLQIRHMTAWATPWLVPSVASERSALRIRGSVV